MKTKCILFAAAVAMTLSFAAPAQAHDHYYYRHHHNAVIYHHPYGYYRPVAPVVTGPVLIVRP